ncbi:TerC family protein [Trichlorobacter ammonificans]|uniref:Integral membrane protein TerC n=1 Tax=Trichlorobacter ammonificans TaxID=2916410 RepID=A0ABN8HH44_9BACT|nr:TerC family protein [Trichlorobacter ammonificans]CAH2030180.1 Integral membrane protein TerC [Trichlorobacter ammonificans]
MDWLADPQAWMALLTLTALEIVLGIDNIIFISILTGKLPEHQRETAQKLGLSLAMITRLLLLFSLTWIMKLTTPFFQVLGHGVSGRDLILIVGGLFLLAKSTMEIHDKLEGEEHHAGAAGAAVSFRGILVQIMFLDIVFSLDSVITAVGMARQLGVMVTAVVISVGVMLFCAGSVSRFVERHPTVKVLALSFLLMIGVALIADGFAFHIPKGYIYFAMAFSVFVEMVNIKVRKNAERPVRLRQQIVK